MRHEHSMIYLKSFNLLDENMESSIVSTYERRTIFNSDYPLHIFPRKGLYDLTFSNITILYGGNGSGKSTLLNIIAEKLDAKRITTADKGAYFHKYVSFCSFEYGIKPKEIKIITSDDIFDYLLDIRAINNHVSRKKEDLSAEYLTERYSKIGNPLEDYESLVNKVLAKKSTMSKYVRTKLTNNTIIEQSNGESALMFWEKEITDNAIYILDEPENSLSAVNQLKLKQFIEDSARFYNCQFIIASHSPFILSLKDALIYDLDTDTVITRKWSELENIRTYYEFFLENKKDFEQ